MTISAICLYAAVVLGFPLIALMRSLRPGLSNMRPRFLKGGALGFALGYYADAVNLYRVKSARTGRSMSIWIARTLLVAFAILMSLTAYLLTLPMYASGQFLGIYWN